MEHPKSAIPSPKPGKGGNFGVRPVKSIHKIWNSKRVEREATSEMCYDDDESLIDEAIVWNFMWQDQYILMKKNGDFLENRQLQFLWTYSSFQFIYVQCSKSKGKGGVAAYAEHISGDLRPNGIQAFSINLILALIYWFL